MKIYKTKNGKSYTKKQITEAIAYWQKKLILENCSNVDDSIISPNTNITLTYSQLKKLIHESIMNEGTTGKNEADVARAVYNAMNRSFGNIPGMLVHYDGIVEYNGNFYAKASKQKRIEKEEITTDSKKTHKRLHPDSVDDLVVKPSIDVNYGKGNTSKQAKIVDIKCQCLGSSYGNYSWAVFELGALQFPGDIAVICSEAANAAVSSATSGKGITSVIEVKSDSLGNRVFNPTFHIKENDAGYFLEPVGRYGSIWNDLIESINNEIAQEKYQSKIRIAFEKGTKGNLLYKFPLDVDFEDFVGRYATKNPFGPIEYLAMGYDDDITFYKLFQNPKMRLYGTGKANRLAKRNAELLGNVFNQAYLTLRFRDNGRLVGQVDFSHNGALMSADADLAVSFE